MEGRLLTVFISTCCYMYYCICI